MNAFLPTTTLVRITVILALSLLNTFGAIGASLPRSSPESEGVASSAMVQFVEALNGIDGMHSFMLLRHGKVIAEGWWTPYGPEFPHELYSLSKSFTSTAVGFAVAEHRLTIDDEVLKFFPEVALTDPSANLKAMRVRDLLTMSAGHQDETSSAPEKISPQAFLAHPVPHKPGTHFKYNTAATFMLSAIVQKLTDQTVLDYLRPRLFDPLGIVAPTWNTNFQGISLGGYGLSVRTEDIARFGQFYLQKGSWGGKQLLPAAWVELATSRQVSNGSNPQSDWDQGYGFQFWRCRHNAYRGDGAFGQYCLVMPEQDAVLAITSGLKDMQGVLNVVWEKLLPALRPTHLLGDHESRTDLAARSAGLTVALPQGQATTSLSAKKLSGTFTFPTNAARLETLSVQPRPGGKGYTLNVKTAIGASTIEAGSGHWERGIASVGTYKDVPIGASAAWKSDDTLVVKICAVQTPYQYTWSLRFSGDQLFFNADSNVAFGPSRQAEVIGTRAAK